jgi:hypothetical protein
MTTKHTVTRLIALSLTVLALAIPSVAAAAPVGPTLGTYHATEQTDPSPSSPSVSGSDSGFNWGDAALGASVAMAVVIIGAGALAMVRGYRSGQTQVRPS